MYLIIIPSRALSLPPFHRYYHAADALAVSPGPHKWTFFDSDMRGGAEKVPGHAYVSSRIQYWKVYIIMTPAVHSFHLPRNWIARNSTLD